MIHKQEKICPRCGRPKIEEWADMSDEDRDLAGRMNHDLEAGPELYQIRVCTGCWHPEREPSTVA